MTGERLHPATPFVRAWLIIAAFAWFVAKEAYRERDSGLALGDLPWWVWLFLALPLSFIALGAWEWWTTRFYIDDTELRIERRGISHESRRIAYSRIQSVDLTQPLSARLLGLAQLTIDVGADEGTALAYLSRSRADGLRAHLLTRAHQDAPVRPRDPAHPSDPAHPDAPQGPTRPWDDLAPDDQVLVKLTLGDLMLGAALAHQLWIIIGILGIAPLVASFFFTDVPLEAFGVGVVPLALAIWGFASSRVTSQFNYSLAQTRSGLKITRGLTTLRTQTVPVHRVQAVQITQSILWRLIGRQRVDLVVLGGADGSDDGEGASSTTLLPIGTAPQVHAALHAVWPDLDLLSIPLTPPPARARWFAPLAYRWLGYGYDDRVVVTRTGWLTRNIAIIPHRRLQSLVINQGPLDRRLCLASVQLHTSQSGGTGRILHADANQIARWVRDEAHRARTTESPATEAKPLPDH